MKWVHNNQDLRDRRRKLRQGQTKAEGTLWFEIGNNKLGVKFKRQHSIGGYIADFYCQKHKLIVELDGKIHDLKERKDYDEVRDKFFTSLGYKVLRFKNKEVENEIGKVLNEIRRSFASPLPCT